MNEPVATAHFDDLLASREKLLSFVQRRVRDPDLAEDVLQNSLLKAVSAGPRLRDQDRLVPWFYSILRNAITDTYRRRAAAPPTVDIEAAAGVELDEEVVTEVCACVRPLVQTLRPEYRELIETLDLGEESTQSVAARLNLSPGNLKVRRHRARQALRLRLEETCRTCAEHHCLDCNCGSGQQQN